MLIYGSSVTYRLYKMACWNFILTIFVILTWHSEYVYLYNKFISNMTNIHLNSAETLWEKMEQSYFDRHLPPWDGNMYTITINVQADALLYIHKITKSISAIVVCIPLYVDLLLYKSLRQIVRTINSIYGKF